MAIEFNRAAGAHVYIAGSDRDHPCLLWDGAGRDAQAMRVRANRVRPLERARCFSSFSVGGEP